jgi:hypothetical protein
MKHIVFHEEIENGMFVGGEKSVTLKSVEDVMKYYEKNLKIAVAQRVKKNRTDVSREFEQKKKEYHLDEILKIEDINKIMAPDLSRDFKKRITLGGAGGTGGAGGNIPCSNWITTHWETDLYEKPHYKGRKYTIGCFWNDVNYDPSLVDNNFNDITSSVDTGKFVILTICCQHIWFGGDWYWFWTDKGDLRNRGCDDCISSVGVTGVSPWSLIRLLLSFL